MRNHITAVPVNEERELTSHVMPEEGVYEVERENKRTNVVRLLPSFQGMKLKSSSCGIFP
ncbi:hypothetical protein MetMK1DRAFT_00024850 [Metallosphaera yellowstonensis MK1]|uniref:Uncharacterized protein n=1 Tax=Metallosphaera yellowstonensis MK1 TaxID=671065 RepID=H2C7D6_9CREN|nr:hypothetical protein MetMK1DRAFT_00024850 [Metallosphaera yellowstonensis MK1]